MKFRSATRWRRRGAIVRHRSSGTEKPVTLSRYSRSGCDSRGAVRGMGMTSSRGGGSPRASGAPSTTAGPRDGVGELVDREDEGGRAELLGGAWHPVDDGGRLVLGERDPARL